MNWKALRLRLRRIASAFFGTVYYDVLGDPVFDDELQLLELIVCTGCGYAVSEDEYIGCESSDETCAASWCLYCWQDAGWGCSDCEQKHESMKP